MTHDEVMTALHPRLKRYLRGLHQVRAYEGIDAMLRTGLLHPRTAARWHRQFGDDLTFFPSYRTEGLGLTHLHLFLSDPDHAWVRFPYAVEALWTTTNLRDDVLYLHCLIPTTQRSEVLRLIEDLRSTTPCKDWTCAWTDTGWQALTLDNKASFTIPPTRTSTADTSVLRDHPFVVPVVCESWNRRASLEGLWHRISAQLRHGLRDYFPGRRVYPVNGKRHVRNAYRALDLLFQQQVIRFRPILRDSLELLLLLPGDAAPIVETLRPHYRAIEVYRGGEHSMVRIAGDQHLLDALITLLHDKDGARAWFVNHTIPEPRARFAYEITYRPRTGEWAFDHDRLKHHMEASQ